MQTWDELKGDKRLKMHAGRVTSALSALVDNLNNPDELKQVLNNMLMGHKARDITLEQFVNLQKVLIDFLKDALGPQLMNEDAVVAWNTTYEFIVQTYKSILSN